MVDLHRKISRYLCTCEEILLDKTIRRVKFHKNINLQKFIAGDLSGNYFRNVLTTTSLSQRKQVRLNQTRSRSMAI